MAAPKRIQSAFPTHACRQSLEIYKCNMYQSMNLRPSFCDGNSNNGSKRLSMQSCRTRIWLPRHFGNFGKSSERMVFCAKERATIPQSSTWCRKYEWIRHWIMREPSAPGNAGVLTSSQHPRTWVSSVCEQLVKSVLRSGFISNRYKFCSSAGHWKPQVLHNCNGSQQRCGTRTWLYIRRWHEIDVG